MLKRLALFALVAGAAGPIFAQTSPPPQNAGTPPPVGPPAVQVTRPQSGLKQRDESAATGTYRVDTGTHILLSMMNTVDTHRSVAGDRLYLETAFPVVSEGRIVIPPGSWVTGTITDVKHGGRLKGRDEMRVRFDSITLPNGVTRNFRADLGSADGRSGETVEGDKKPIAQDVAIGAASGTAVGAGVGAVRNELGRGIGIGAGAGAAAGLGWALLTHAPDARLNKGSSVEMVLDRPIAFTADELDFSNAPTRPVSQGASAPPLQQRRRLPLPRIPY